MGRLVSIVLLPTLPAGFHITEVRDVEVEVIMEMQTITQTEQQLKVSPNAPVHGKNGEHAYKIQVFDKVNLKKIFPVSYVRYVLQQSAGPIALVILAATPSLRLLGPRAVFFPSSIHELIVSSVLALLVIAMVWKMLYEMAHLMALEYENDGFRLVIRRGILYKKEASLPLLPVSEIYLERDFLDLLFGTYDLNVATPVGGSRALGAIHGLNKKNARGLEHFLAKQLNRQIFLADQPQGQSVEEAEVTDIFQQ